MALWARVGAIRIAAIEIEGGWKVGRKQDLTLIADS